MQFSSGFILLFFNCLSHQQRKRGSECKQVFDERRVTLLKSNEMKWNEKQNENEKKIADQTKWKCRNTSFNKSTTIKWFGDKFLLCWRFCFFFFHCVGSDSWAVFAYRIRSLLWLSVDARWAQSERRRMKQQNGIVAFWWEWELRDERYRYRLFNEENTSECRLKLNNEWRWVTNKRNKNIASTACRKQLIRQQNAISVFFAGLQVNRLVDRPKFKPKSANQRKYSFRLLIDSWHWLNWNADRNECETKAEEKNQEQIELAYFSSLFELTRFSFHYVIQWGIVLPPKRWNTSKRASNERKCIMHDLHWIAIDSHANEFIFLYFLPARNGLMRWADNKKVRRLRQVTFFIFETC